VSHGRVRHEAGSRVISFDSRGLPRQPAAYTRLRHGAEGRFSKLTLTRSLREARSETLASASGSTCQTTTLVTPSPRPVVCAAALLELARWCQQRLVFMEDSESCPDAHFASQRPPACIAAILRGGATLATPGAPGSAIPDCRVDADAPATPPRPQRNRRKGGGQ
jgi:hypothetical protein